MIVHESPRVMAPAEFFEDAPLMEDDMTPSHSVAVDHPSLLAYRPSMATRSVWAQPPMAKPKYQAQVQQPFRSSVSSRDSFGRTSVWTTDDEYDNNRYQYASDDDYAPTYTDDDETKEEEEDDRELFDDEMMEEEPLSVIAKDVPLLEVDEEEPEKEVDTIIGDLSRLPRTTVIDEDGFLIDHRASIAGSSSSFADSSMGLVRPGVVIKSGLLFKQGFGFMNGGWKVRFAQLTSSKLTFFKEEYGRKRGEIDLSKCSLKSIEIMPQDSVFDGSQATMWRFAIKHKGRRILLSAYSEPEMKEWLRCLHVALAVQSAGAGRFTDLVVPNGTLLAGKSDGLMRASGSGLLR